MSLDYINIMDRIINSIGSLIETIVNVVITFSNSLLLIFMAMFVIGLLWAVFQMLKVSNQIESRGRN